jgi:hypothetical protein
MRGTCQIRRHTNRFRQGLLVPDLRTLAIKLDAAEIAWRGDDGKQESWSTLRAAKQSYFKAVRNKWLEEQAKLDGAKLVRIDIYKLAKLEKEMMSAQTRLARLQNLGEEFYLFRELLDAEAALEASEGRFEILRERFDPKWRQPNSKFKKAQRAFNAEIRRENAEKLFGIARSPKARAVTDGYVKTGKFKMVDGVRVPVLEKVE